MEVIGTKRKVFVVVVVYNGIKWLDKCLSSLTSVKHEITTIAVDNNSTDGSTQLIEKNFPEVEVVKSTENLGFGRANNKGIKIALENGADYVVLLNQDAWFVNGTLDFLIDEANINVSFDILSPLHLRGDGQGLDFYFSKYIRTQTSDGFINNLILKREFSNPVEINFVNAAAWLVKVESIRTVGLFDPLFPHYGEDRDYIERFHFFKKKIGIVSSSQICHDRLQGPRVKHDLQTKVILSYLKLKKLNLPFYQNYLSFMRLNLGDQILCLSKGKFSEWLLYIKTLFIVTLQISIIYQSYKASKLPGAFLNQ